MNKDLPCTCAVTIFNPTKDRVLVVHPNGAKFSMWSLPKGLADENEMHNFAAVREVQEETGLIIDVNRLQDHGMFSYVREKNYHMFSYVLTDEVDASTLICESMFTSKNGELIPEVDNFCFVPVDQAVLMLNIKQREIFKCVFNLN